MHQLHQFAQVCNHIRRSSLKHPTLDGKDGLHPWLIVELTGYSQWWSSKEDPNFYATPLHSIRVNLVSATSYPQRVEVALQKITEENTIFINTCVCKPLLFIAVKWLPVAEQKKKGYTKWKLLNITIWVTSRSEPPDRGDIRLKSRAQEGKESCVKNSSPRTRHEAPNDDESMGTCFACTYMPNLYFYWDWRYIVWRCRWP